MCEGCWHQYGRVEFHAFGNHLWAFGFGGFFPDGFNGVVVFAFVEQDAEHGQFTFGVFVDKVRHHRHGLAIDLFFARTVEVELQQVVDVFVDLQRATWLHIDLDGVAVVQNLQRAFFVRHSQDVFGFLERSDDVQRRLLGAVAASGELTAPFVWTHFADIVPMDSMGFCFVIFKRAISQNLDFLTRCCERILRSTNRLETRCPLGHF